MEIRQKDHEFVTFKHKCGMDQSFIMECSGEGKERVRGIAMLWRESHKILVSSYSLNHINFEVLMKMRRNLGSSHVFMNFLRSIIKERLGNSSKVLRWIMVRSRFA